MLKKEPERVRAWLFLSCCASKRLFEYKDPTPLSMLGQLSSMHTTHVLGFDTKALRQYSTCSGAVPTQAEAERFTRPAVHL